MKRLLSVIGLLFVLLTTKAQTEIRGYVEDSLSHERLPSVSVTLYRDGKPIKFVRSQNDGRFVIAVAEQKEGDQLQASYMGYKKRRVPVSKGKETIISLASTAFQLKEVQVQGSRVSGRDTVTFDLTRFTSERDNSLKDVLKKLPGVDVAKDGKISYNGQNINRFTVEGLDLTNGRYKILTDNIKAKDVKKAEIIEHDQPIKALQNKTFTDNIAMNIALKDSARDQIMPTLKPYLLVGDPTHVGGDVNIMQIGKKKQLMYHAGYDRSGVNFDNALDILASYHNRLPAASLPSWLSVPSLSSPISDSQRLRFNTSQKYTVNHITKSKTGNENRLQASYIRSVTRQETENASIYDLGGERPVTTTERQHKTMTRDAVNLEWEHRVNQDAHYGNEKISVDASQGDGLASINDTLTQRIRVPKVNVEAALYRVYVKEKWNLTWLSTADYHHSVSDLYVNEERNRIRTNLWHTAHSLGWSRDKGYFRRSWTLKGEVENMNVGGNNYADIEVELQPVWRYETQTLRLSFSPTYKWERLTYQNKNFFKASPSLYFNKKIGNRQELTASASYNHSLGNKNSYTLNSYRKSYRSWYEASDVIPENRVLYGSLNYSYKRPIREFFMRAKVSGSRYWMNTASDLRIIDGNYYTSLYEQDSKSDNINTLLYLSKGFYKLNLKTTLTGEYGYSKGTQYSSHTAIDYTANNYTLTPTLTFTPSFCQVMYEGNFSWYASKHEDNASTTLFNWRQELSLTASIHAIDLTFSLVHYRNELQEGNNLNCLLGDAEVVWRVKKIRFSAELRNIFNKKSYVETTYSGISTLTDSYILRPRELKVTAQFSL